MEKILEIRKYIEALDAISSYEACRWLISLGKQHKEHFLNKVLMSNPIGDVDGVVAELRRVLRKSGRFCTISCLWNHHRFHGAHPTLNDRILHVFRDHCPHQMLPLELPTILLNNGFAGINSMPIPLLNMTMHNNAFARWISKLVAAFAIGNGLSENDVALWLRQLEEAERDGHFGFVSMSVLTTGLAI